MTRQLLLKVIRVIARAHALLVCRVAAGYFNSSSTEREKKPFLIFLVLSMDGRLLFLLLNCWFRLLEKTFRRFRPPACGSPKINNPARESSSCGILSTTPTLFLSFYLFTVSACRAFSLLLPSKPLFVVLFVIFRGGKRKYFKRLFKNENKERTRSTTLP